MLIYCFLLLRCRIKKKVLPVEVWKTIHATGYSLYDLSTLSVFQICEKILQALRKKEFLLTKILQKILLHSQSVYL